MRFGHTLNMTDLKLSFDIETMLLLTREQFKQLATTSETITDFAPAKDYWIEEDFSRLFLSVDGSLSSYFFEFEPEGDIDAFIKHSYLTHFFPKTGRIKLINNLEEPLCDILPKKGIEVINLPIIDKLEFSEKQDIFSDPLNETSVDTLVRTGNFKGQISCCECGDGGCSSEYLWAEEDFGLASFHILAAGLQAVHLYPFKLG